MRVEWKVTWERGLAFGLYATALLLCPGMMHRQKSVSVRDKENMYFQSDICARGGVAHGRVDKAIRGQGYASIAERVCAGRPAYRVPPLQKEPHLWEDLDNFHASKFPVWVRRKPRIAGPV